MQNQITIRKLKDNPNAVFATNRYSISGELDVANLLAYAKAKLGPITAYRVTKHNGFIINAKNKRNAIQVQLK